MSVDMDALAAAADGFSAIVEVAAGHRQKCEAAGFSPTAAEHMAVHLHNLMVNTALGPKTS